MASDERESDILYEHYDGASPTTPAAPEPYGPPPSYPGTGIMAEPLVAVAVAVAGPPRREGGAEVYHRRLSVSDESDTSSVDERLSVASIASSIEDQLT